MLKRCRVPGRLALNLRDLGVSVPAILRKAGLLRDMFEQTISGIELRVLIDLAREETCDEGTERRESFILILGGPLRLQNLPGNEAKRISQLLSIWLEGS